MSIKKYLSINGLTILVDNIKAYVDLKIANLVNSAPDTLDTLGELAMAFQENEEVVNRMSSSDFTSCRNYDDATECASDRSK